VVRLVYLLQIVHGARLGKSVETWRIIRQTPSASDDDENVEESPEQILARLVRYRDSLNHAPEFPAAPARVWSHAGAARRAWTRSTVPATIVGQLLAVIACALAVRAFEQFDHTVALEIVGGTAAVGLIAALRRVPLALWLTVGVVVGGVLGRWS
jgi:hypothetical protein